MYEPCALYFVKLENFSNIQFNKDVRRKIQKEKKITKLYLQRKNSQLGAHSLEILSCEPQGLTWTVF